MALVAIVDDRVTNRNIFSKLAASIAADIEVRAFGAPRDALAWLQQNQADLVITDYKMPEMDGADFVGALRAIPGAADIPVVVITVYEERSYRLRALEAGATDFLNSPVDHHEFVTRTRNLLALRRHQKLLAERAETLAEELANSERSRERAIRDSIERLAQVIDTLPVLINAVDREGRTLFVNEFETDFFGVDPAAVVGKPLAELTGPTNADRNRALDQLVFTTGKALPAFEEDLVSAAGRRRSFLTTKTPLRDHAGAVSGVLTSSLDITAHKRTEEHLRYLAHHDPLTSLPNRTLLSEKLRAAIARARRGDKVFALHLIDLDGFKSVNDVHGHSIGDRFLKSVGGRLAQVIREADTLARLGGDEFAILQSEVASNYDVAEFAARIADCVASFVDPALQHLKATASIGVAIHPNDGADAEELLRNADLAMYKAKGEGGNAYCMFAADMQARARSTLDLESSLREALANEQFVLHYQPQFSAVTKEIVGVEALLRWNRPDAGLVGPGVFLPHAEESGLIIPINEWVLNRACADAYAWQRLGLPAFRVAINMSPIQFRKKNVPLQVARVLSETGLESRRLELELTENIVMQDVEAVAKDLRELNRLGVSVAIDDFGTGYSSLSYIKRLPVQRIKIDQSFVRNMTQDPNDAAIVRAIVTLGRSLALDVVAEGVETQQQLQCLREAGCDYAQGFLLGRPMPADDIVALFGKQPSLAMSA
ncbi:MAG: EAL domain-containing protein [Hyphomicrobiales bacterium]|nr:EAL domain-containing protein [Hyphomicrobiales bacterium]